MRHIAESSLSLLSEKHLQRLRQNGFQAILPGIESWYDMGNKSKTRRTGMDKVQQVSEHVNMILRYIPYIQTNFVMGLDGDMGPEPFELTKKFIDLSPGAFPAYSLLSAFGRAAPMNLDYQRAGRVLPFPFHFLNNNHAMNVRPKNYTWPEFYKHLVDVTRYSFSWKAIARRIPATPTMIPKWMNVVRAISSEGLGRIRYHETDRADCCRPIGRSGAIWRGKPTCYPSSTPRASGESWGRRTTSCPKAPCTHDPNAYLHATTEPAMVKTVQLGAPMAH